MEVDGAAYRKEESLKMRTNESVWQKRGTVSRCVGVRQSVWMRVYLTF